MRSVDVCSLLGVAAALPSLAQGYAIHAPDLLQYSLLGIDCAFFKESRDALRLHPACTQLCPFHIQFDAGLNSPVTTFAADI
jgi:hypothetical protein